MCEIKLQISESLVIHSSLKLKHRSGNNLLAEGFDGDDLCRRTGQWMTKSRRLNHVNDSYTEIVADPLSGNEIHHCEEPLTKHLGHGSDRSKRAKCSDAHAI
jgi:hypothetical protein